MKRPMRILVVDEEPVIGRVIGDALEEADVEVRSARDETQAITILTEPCDLLFLHRQLPDSMCSELVRLARHHVEPAVILLASQKSLETERNMLRLGAAEILYKPLDPLEIRACVERYAGVQEDVLEDVPGGPRILVVDDNSAVLRSVRDILDDEDYDVTSTTSPYEALKWLRESPFEIMLADLTMDELPGLEMIRAALNTRPSLQTIVMTGYGSKRNAVAALKQGVYDFLEKPLTPDVVRQAVARAWKTLRYQQENRRLLGALRSQLDERERLLAEREALIVDLETKNAEMERFVYTVSHDLRTPLVTIKGFAGQLWEDATRGTHDRLERDIEHITTAADRMHRLLEELLDLSRIGRAKGPSEMVDPKGLVAKVVEGLAQPIAERGLVIEIGDSLPQVLGDRARLLEVFQNLIGNAVKFLGDKPSPRIEIGAEIVDGEPTFYVRDNGIGIDSKYHDKIFGLFDRLDAVAEGTGIGLALTKRIVEVHGGRIWVESSGLGQGSTFFFTLPAAD